MATNPDRRAGYLILGGFIVAFACLLVWFALDLGGLMPGDSPVLEPDEPATVLPETSS